MTTDCEVHDWLHGCGARYAPSSGAVPDRALRPLTVDVHCHVVSPLVEKLVADTPQKRAERALLVETQGEASVVQNERLGQHVYERKGWTVAERLADMDAMGVDIQALTPSPVQYYYWADDDLAEEIVGSHNGQIARIVGSNPDRFVGLGSVALQNPQLAVKQLTHAISKLGLKGVQISSLVNGIDVCDSRFEPFWAQAEALGALVYLHPLGSTLGARLNHGYLCNSVGQPAETAIALTKLIETGLFDRLQHLKLCASHGGGYLPLYSARADHAWSIRPEACGCRERPSSYLKRIWYDTIVYDPLHLARLIEAVGVDRLVIGTDYPYDMGHYDPHGLVGAVPGLNAKDREGILGLNAIRMLGLDSPNSPVP